jgi:hypothetical protein
MNQPFRLDVSLIVVVFLVESLRACVVDAAENGNFAHLVDIGGGRQMYLECKGAGSPTVVFISGTRVAHDDWTVLLDTTSPGGARKSSQSAVLSQVSTFTRVCAYDRPGNEKHITNTNSGHEIHKEQPQLVIDAIREVVDAVRSGRRQLTR